MDDLPRPNASDDPQKAAEAGAWLKNARKEARTIAADQVRRLEESMVTRRRWTGGDFRDVWLEHPLLRHLSRRLLWATCDEHTFRIDESGGTVDAEDAAFELSDAALVVLVHPLEIDATARARWSQVFADYEIVQPFPQLGRAVHRLHPEETGAASITRLAGAVVHPGKVVSLEKRGWERGPVEDGPSINYMKKALGRATAVLPIEPGLIPGEIHRSPEQTLQAVHFEDVPPAFTLGSLDPISFSELIADLESIG